MPGTNAPCRLALTHCVCCPVCNFLFVFVRVVLLQLLFDLVSSNFRLTSTGIECAELHCGRNVVTCHVCELVETHVHILGLCFNGSDFFY